MARFDYLLLVALVVVATPAEAQIYTGVNQWCQSASHRRLCTRMVNGAVTREEATMNALKTTLEFAKRVQGMIDLVKPAIAKFTPEKQETILATCTEDLAGNVDDLEMSIGAFQSNDIGTVRSHLSASLSSQCQTMLTEMRVLSPLIKYKKLMHKEVDNCLAVLTQE